MKTPYKRIALIFSLCALILWGVLGTGASLAWFADTSDEINNIFHFADFDVKASYYDKDGNWKEIGSTTKVFDENAIFEPGYVEVVYLKIENCGDLPFEFYTAVNVNNCKSAKNVFGNDFFIQDYLTFGVLNVSEDHVVNHEIDRDIAKANAQILLADVANMPLHNYYTETAVLAPDDTVYIALIVRMPENVGNVANYRGDDIPSVELGITVRADQIVD